VRSSSPRRRSSPSDAACKRAQAPGLLPADQSPPARRARATAHFPRQHAPLLAQEQVLGGESGCGSGGSIASCAWVTRHVSTNGPRRDPQTELQAECRGDALLTPGALATAMSAMVLGDVPPQSCNRERPHATLGPEIPDPPTDPTALTGHRLLSGHRVAIRARLGGLHHDYRLESIAA
jgi:hypothetical protein